ncbi:hypothetical protein CALVIDRAFT_526880 [Calocera viscosa TUFC12733]|uniref:Uncharacterized protein n=1 Tax=Calocera viscosa (strain TUFC12733) TaxID=1330018 RepID=A0A167N555_CALVF|nr:hypothetical protein CALVIDRAFT_526880 [Calocera viscosa TUFC12733]
MPVWNLNAYPLYWHRHLSTLIAQKNATPYNCPLMSAFAQLQQVMQEEQENLKATHDAEWEKLNKQCTKDFAIADIIQMHQDLFVAQERRVFVQQCQFHSDVMALRAKL